MKDKNNNLLIIIILIVAVFLFMSLSARKSPTLVVEFKDADLILRKIGLVGYSEPMNMVCEGYHLEAIVQTPSNNSVFCTKNCVVMRNVERIYCSNLPRENGTYSINVKVYESSSTSEGKVLLDKNLSGEWEK